MSTLYPARNYTTAITVDQTPHEVFAAINNVRGWWSEEIEGSTDKLSATFKYHFQDVHRCTMKITELIPNKKIVWHVLDNYFSFTKDETEWKNTQIIFELTEMDNKTEVSFTHLGLVPEYECYKACSEGWSNYINGSLSDLIATGKGQPNTRHAITGSERALLKQDYTTTITVDQTPQQVFAAINNVRGWWKGDIAGNTNKLGDEFTYRYQKFHYSRHKITELITDKKVVWFVPDASLDFVKDRKEWTGTKIIFEITRRGDKTELRFTHAGLIPALECYDTCSDAWSGYIVDSLHNLITTGKGQTA